MNVPMRGGLAAALASLLRLQRGELGGRSVPTVKRVLSDDPDVADGTRAEILDALCDAIFPAEYLRARGLSDSEAAQHQGDVRAAFGGILDAWDPVARFANRADELAPELLDWIALTQMVPREIAVRAAAFHALHAGHHSAIDRCGAWAPGPQLSAWFRDASKRASRQLTIEGLHRLSRPNIDRNTLKAIRSGARLPRADTIDVLSEALAKCAVAEPIRRTPMSAAEIAFEIRIACAFKQLMSHLSGVHATTLGLLVDELRFVRAFLTARPREHAHDLLVNGSRSRHYAELDVELQLRSVQSVVGMVHERQVKLHRRFLEDPDALPSLLADDLERTTAELPAFAKEHPIAGLFGHMAALMRAVERGEAPPPAPYDERELEASVLVQQAIAPSHWENAAKDDREREVLLRRAIDIWPAIGEAREHLAFLLAGRGAVEEALEQLRAAVRLSPEPEEARELLVDLLWDTGRWSEIVDAASAQPELSAKTRALYGGALLRLDRIDRAEIEIEAALAQNPRVPITLSLAAEIARLRGRSREASKYEAAAYFYATGSNTGNATPSTPQ